MSLRGLYALDPWARGVIAVGCVLAASAAALSSLPVLSTVPLLLAVVVSYRPVPGGRWNLVPLDERDATARRGASGPLRITTGVLFLAAIGSAMTGRPLLAAALGVVSLSALLVGEIVR